MKYFRKLNINHNFQKPKLGKEWIRYGLNIGGRFHGIKYWYLLEKGINYTKNFIPEQYQKDFFLSYMEVNSNNLFPHTDSNSLTTINFYICTHDEVTSFYAIKNVNPITSKFETQTNGQNYKLKDLVEEENFVAKNQEIYILDVSKPHGVSSNALYKKNVRSAICMQTVIYKFHEVCEMLKETQYLN